MPPLNIGIIGTGSRGIHCFGMLFQKRDDCRVAALADLNPVRLNAARDMLQDSSIDLYTSAQEMVTKADLDAVIITTPDYMHCEHVLAALNAGRHVLVDKPLSTRTSDCLRIARAVRESGCIVDMGFNLRHEIVCKKIKQLIDSGAIGRVHVIDNRDYYNGGRTYMGRWNRFYEKSGGLFCHKGSHDFDLLNWYSGGGLPVRVSAFAQVNVLTPEGLPFELKPGEKAGPYCQACQVFDKCPDRVDISDNPLFTGAAREADGYDKDTCIFLSEKDTHDNGIAIVEYDNGIRASHWECFFTPLSTRRFTIIGNKGHLDADLSTSTVSIYPRWTQDRIDYTLGRPEGGHGGADPMMVESFVNNLRSGAAPCASVREGTLSVVIADAAERSRREGRTVEIAELLPKEELMQLG